jgi:hypothetical protein
MGDFNKTENVSLESFLEFIELLAYIYIRPSISVYNFISNLFCALILIEILKKYNQSNSKMYYYFIFKSTCDMLVGLIETFYPLYGIKRLSVSQSYYIMVWYIYFHQYIVRTLILISGFCEVAASFDCAISIDRQLKWFHKWSSFFVITGLVVIFSFVFSLYSFFDFGIGVKGDEVNSSLNQTITLYKIIEKPFYDSTTSYYFHYINSFLKDVFTIVSLFIINLYILVKLRKIRKRKKRLLNLSKYDSMKTKPTRAEQAERRKLRMIFALCLIYVFGHLPNFLYHFNLITSPNSYFLIVIFSLADVLCYLSYGTPIFVYYFFNKQFKLILLRKICFGRFSSEE